MRSEITPIAARVGSRHDDQEISVETDFGQTDFGHLYPTDLGQTDFGQTDFGQS